ncbi:MAG: hypothetical protein CME06_00820 [Gemmatimonadetes bacterium]|nr:hypothetical protein [Gemmatimonadota bacterium]
MVEDSDPNRLRWRDFITLPNGISMLRVVAMPFLIWGLANDLDGWVFGAYLVAVLSDAIDGTVARRLGAASLTGRIVDPLADKVALGTTYVALSVWRSLPWWLTVLVLARDLVIMGIGAFVYRRRRTIPSSTQLGQISVTVLALVGLVYAARWSGAAPTAAIIGGIAIALSFVHYLYRATGILAGTTDGVRTGAGMNWLDFLIGSGDEDRSK